MPRKVRQAKVWIMQSIFRVLLFFGFMAATASCVAGESNLATMVKAPSAESSPCILVKGSASSEGVDEDFARKMAIRDALKQASMKNNLQVRTDQSVENYQLKLDSARFVSASKVKSFTVVKEGYEDAEDLYGQAKKGALNYEVTLNACLTEERGICANLPGNQYQPRLAIAPIVVARPQDAHDISNLISGYQLELQRRIDQQNYRNFTLVDGVIDIQPNMQIKPNLNSEQLAVFREQTGAQYLLLTVLRTLVAEEDKDGVGALKNSVKRFYHLQVDAEKRYIEMDWYLVDLMSKKLVHQARAGFNVEGQVAVGRDKAFGTNSFFSTDTGKVFHALLEQQVTDTLDFLHCKPYQTEIIDVRGEQYIVYLHEDSGAKVGDDLAVYHRSGRPVRYQGVELGDDFEPGAFLKIKRIMPRFAIAEVTAKKQSIQIGDRVKAW